MSGTLSSMGGLPGRTKGSQRQCTASQRSQSRLTISALPRNISPCFSELHKYCPCASSDYSLYSTLMPTVNVSIHVHCPYSLCSLYKDDPNGFLKQRGWMGPKIRWVACQGEPKDADSNAWIWYNQSQDQGILCLKTLVMKFYIQLHWCSPLLVILLVLSSVKPALNFAQSLQKKPWQSVQKMFLWQNSTVFLRYMDKWIQDAGEYN